MDDARAPNPIDLVILVDADDRPIGEAEKIACHHHPVPLHRAFSVFLFDAAGRMLITQRSQAKATWPGSWSNACCSHPRPGEDVAAGAARRVREELGLEAELRPLFSFVYDARYDDTHGEHELDHVFVGALKGEPTPDPTEIEAWRLVDAETLRAELAERPEAFSPWFRLSVERVLAEDRSSRAGG